MAPKAGNRFLAAADKLEKASARAKTQRVNEYLAKAEERAAHIERIGYRPRKESWSESAMMERERGVLRQLETTASQCVYPVYDKATRSLVKV
jgi:hypothetical protein